MKMTARISVLAATSIATTTMAATPAAAASTQIDGSAVFDMSGTTCTGPPEGFEDFISYPPLILSGSLEGCWYTKVDSVSDHGAPSGIYLETGREVFVGSLDGRPMGMFATGYKFESQWDPDVATGTEVRGRCQHPIVTGSGTGGFAGVTGRLDFKDIVIDGSYVYRGHLSNP